jgi:SecD/SecF fusion protein
MSGGVVTDAKIHSISQEKAVSMQMNGQGAKGWEELTGRAYTQKVISLLFLIILYSAPGVSSGPGGVDLKSLGRLT